ncbi:MAG: GNAT family N-acetyltransferase [Planctomycetes bacterium]|nr:GNAT family N-acetyltransferase [Planctomycetota bacterium]
MPFLLQPTLKGELLELRPLRPEDFDALYAVASDPLIWEQHPEHDRWKEEVFREFFRVALESGGAFLVVDARDGRVIGSSRFHGYDEEKSEVEIGWTFLARSHWGGRYNREMKDLLLRHAFRFVKSVVFLVGSQNLRSQRAMEKIGGVREGTRARAGGGESVVFRISAPTPAPVTRPEDLLPGELFEDCRYHPCLCIESGSPGDSDAVYGISLVDGTPCGCSIVHCALRKLTVAEAVQWKRHGPPDAEVDKPWWDAGGPQGPPA